MTQAFHAIAKRCRVNSKNRTEHAKRKFELECEWKTREREKKRFKGKLRFLLICQTSAPSFLMPPCYAKHIQ